MEGFLTGFAMTPKPLKGVEAQEIRFGIKSDLSIKQVLKAITTHEGLSSWLGETGKFIAHVGIKFETTIGDTKSKCVITALDIPKLIVFMVSGVGELKFSVSEKGQNTEVELVITWAVAQADVKVWKELVESITSKLEIALKNA